MPRRFRRSTVGENDTVLRPRTSSVAATLVHADTRRAHLDSEAFRAPRGSVVSSDDIHAPRDASEDIPYDFSFVRLRPRLERVLPMGVGPLGTNPDDLLVDVDELALKNASSGLNVSSDLQEPLNPHQGVNAVQMRPSQPSINPKDRLLLGNALLVLDPTEAPGIAGYCQSTWFMWVFMILVLGAGGLLGISYVMFFKGYSLVKGLGNIIAIVAGVTALVWLNGRGWFAPHVILRIAGCEGNDSTQTSGPSESSGLLEATSIDSAGSPTVTVYAETWSTIPWVYVKRAYLLSEIDSLAFETVDFRSWNNRPSRRIQLHVRMVDGALSPPLASVTVDLLCKPHDYEHCFEYLYQAFCEDAWNALRRAKQVVGDVETPAPAVAQM